MRKSKREGTTRQIGATTSKRELAERKKLINERLLYLSHCRQRFSANAYDPDRDLALVMFQEYALDYYSVTTVEWLGYRRYIQQVLWRLSTQELREWLDVDSLKVICEKEKQKANKALAEETEAHVKEYEKILKEAGLAIPWKKGKG
ncbi:unnamed protein product [marine sediment metagenome]|uniref:Uncharacterized protein n=1 Tax=marine sediment metagenome TaxID=412755 RepID=X1JNG9_9ZZZZ